jgi:hypothetical protein
MNQNQDCLCLLRLRPRAQTPASSEAAASLGKIFAENNIRSGLWRRLGRLMGAIAKSSLDHGGAVTGIIPDFLRAREIALTKVQEMIVTPDMHERKRLMFERSDAFVALPGGVGTLEELVEHADLAAARPPRQADPARQHRRLLGDHCSRCSRICAAAQFIRPNLEVNILKRNASRISCRASMPPPRMFRKPPGRWRRSWRGRCRRRRSLAKHTPLVITRESG